MTSNKSIITLFGLIGLLSQANLNSATLRLQDDTISVSIMNVLYTNVAQDLAARWGTWNSLSSSFTEISGGGGYFSADLGEVKVDLDRTSQVVPVGTPLAIAIYQALPQTAYQPSFNRIVLTDPLWLAPTFDLSPTVTPRFFSANTSAVFGAFNFNSGNETLNLIPEPSSMSLVIMGLAQILAFRRRALAKGNNCD